LIRNTALASTTQARIMSGNRDKLNCAPSVKKKQNQKKIS
jgi:hypothetical protein